MIPVEEAYEGLVLREEQLILQIKTIEMAVSILLDELVYRQRGNTCVETIMSLCERIQEQEAKLRRELFTRRWEKTMLACQFPIVKKQAEESPL